MLEVCFLHTLLQDNQTPEVRDMLRFMCVNAD